jgi:hypothetical protein
MAEPSEPSERHALEVELDALKVKHAEVVDRFRDLIGKYKASQATIAAHDGEAKGRAAEADARSAEAAAALAASNALCAELKARLESAAPAPAAESGVAEAEAELLRVRAAGEAELQRVREAAEAKAAAAATELAAALQRCERAEREVSAAKAAAAAAEGRARAAETAAAAYSEQVAMQEAAARAAASAREGAAGAAEGEASSLRLRLSSAEERAGRLGGEAAALTTALAASQATVEGLNAASTRLKAMLVKTGALLKASKAAESARAAAPVAFAVLATLRVPPSVLQAVGRAAGAQECGEVPSPPVVDASSVGWHLIGRCDEVRGGAGEGEGPSPPSYTVRLEWVPVSQVGQRGWVGWEAGEGRTEAPRLLALMPDLLAVGRAAFGPALEEAGGMCGEEVLMALAPFAETTAEGASAALAALLRSLARGRAESAAAAASSLRAARTEVVTLREELGAHRARSAAVVRAAEGRARVAEEEAVRVREEGARRVDEAQVEGLVESVGALTRRAEGAEGALVTLRAAVEVQAARHAAELAAARLPSPVTCVGTCLGEVAKQRERGDASEVALATARAALAAAVEMERSLRESATHSAASPLPSHLVEDRGARSASSSHPRSPSPSPTHAHASSLLDKGVGHESRASAVLEKLLAGGSAGRAGGRLGPASARRAHRARGLSGIGEGGEGGSSTPLDVGVLHRPFPLGPGSREEEDFEEDTAQEEARMLAERCGEAEAEVGRLRGEVTRLRAAAEVAAEARREAERAEARSASLLAPSPRGSSTASPATGGPTVSLQYLKNSVVAFMATGSARERAAMLPAIALLLKLGPGECASIVGQLEREGASVVLPSELGGAPSPAGRGLLASLFG